MVTDQREAFAQLEYAGWQRVAGQYESAWSGLTSLFIDPLLESVEVGPGMALLDVATGPGYVAESARALGAAAVGLDFSIAMVRLARKRVPDVVFVCGDAQALPFASATLDRVTMNFGLLHLPDPEAALAEARRVLRSGGRYGFTIWAGPEQSPGARIIDEAVRNHANVPADLPQGPDYYGYGDADACRSILARCGFDRASVRFRTIVATWQVPSASFVFAAERDAGVRTAALLAVQPPSVLAAIEEQMAAGFSQFRQPTGFAIPYAAHVVTATAV